MHLIVPFCPALLAGAEEDSTRCSLILGVIKNEHQPRHLPPSLAVSTPLVQWSQPVLILCSVYSFFPCFFFFFLTILLTLPFGFSGKSTREVSSAGTSPAGTPRYADGNWPVCLCVVSAQIVVFPVDALLLLV